MFEVIHAENYQDTKDYPIYKMLYNESLIINEYTAFLYKFIQYSSHPLTKRNDDWWGERNHPSKYITYQYMFGGIIRHFNNIKRYGDEIFNG